MKQLFLFCCLFSRALLAQFSDDFSDGNLRFNPSWEGDTAIFNIANGQLNLNAPPVSGAALVAAPSQAICNSKWELKISLDFNPSSANYVRVYLAANQPTINDQFKGYYVEIGNTGDDVSLYRQSGTTSFKLIDGADGRLNYAAVQLVIRVETDAFGNWSLYSDTGATGPTGVFLNEGIVHDVTFTTSAWFLLECVFTATRSDKFHFDDIKVKGIPFPDNQNPILEKIGVIASDRIVLGFSEPVTMTNPTNYNFITDKIKVQSVEFNTGKDVILHLDAELSEGSNHQLKLSGITDLAGNSMKDTVVRFDYYLPRPAGFRDVIISEILADPDPAVANQFPEFVEIFNRSEFTINLSGWIFTDHSTISVLPEYNLLPETSVVMSACTGNLLPAVSNKICLEKFPSLNNTGDRLLLIDAARNVIDSVNYQTSWHAVSEKASGGWSLELIDPGNICKDSENWTSSVDPEGGTPGRINSVSASVPDISGPEISQVDVTTSQAVQIIFNERLNQESLEKQNFLTEPSSGDFNFFRAGASTIRLDFDFPLESDQVYRIRMKNLKDCIGNHTEKEFTEARVLISTEPDSTAVLINEILFNPKPGGTDYLELFNNTERSINLKNWSVKNGRSSVDLLPNFISYPGSFIVLTDDKEILKHQFPGIPDSVIIEYPLPSFPDDEGVVMLISPSGRMLDSLYYNQNFHLRLIKDDEGIALERLSANAPTYSKDNWISAGLNGGSPGFVNPSAAETDLGTGFFVEPEVFSCRSGTCFTMIFYETDRPEMMINLSVFRLDGHLVKTLCRNEHLTGNGFIRWDGDSSDGQPAGAGIFIIEAEVFDASGYFQIFRSRAIIMPESQ